MRVKFLAAVPIEAISAQEVLVHIFSGIDVLWDQEAAGCPARFAMGRFELREKSARTFQSEMVHQVVAELAERIAESFGEARRARVEQDACGLERARG